MALNIEDPETEKAVRQAVKKDLGTDELSEEEKERRVAAAMARREALYKKYDIKPAERSMTKDEMDDAIGYDETGRW